MHVHIGAVSSVDKTLVTNKHYSSADFRTDNGGYALGHI